MAKTADRAAAADPFKPDSGFVLLGSRVGLTSAERRAWVKENISDVRDVDNDHFIRFNSPGLVADVIMEEETIN